MASRISVRTEFAAHGRKSRISRNSAEYDGFADAMITHSWRRSARQGSSEEPKLPAHQSNRFIINHPDAGERMAVSITEFMGHMEMDEI